MYEDKVWFRVNELAEYLGVHVDTIRRWVRDPKHPLRGSKITPDGPWMFKKAYVDSILETMTGEPNDGQPPTEGVV